MVNAANCFVIKSIAHKQDHNSEGQMQNAEWLST